MITLLNDFHQSLVRLRPRGDRLSASQVKRARRVLCGYDGCTCGGVCGERGRQPDTLAITGRPDGSAEIIY